MKKQFQEFIKDAGLTCSYSGTSRTMYVHGEISEDSKKIVNAFGSMIKVPFKIEFDKQIPDF